MLLGGLASSIVDAANFCILGVESYVTGRNFFDWVSRCAYEDIDSFVKEDTL